MKSYVVTIMDDVCVKNGKDATMQANLITKLREYGTVEAYEEHIAKHDAKWQRSLDEIKAEHEKVKAVACKDNFELAILKACRVSTDNAVSAVNAEKEKYRAELESHKEKLEVLKANITAVLGE
jgi:prefoldin subunit 5